MPDSAADLLGLLAALDPLAPRAQRHSALVRLVRWLAAGHAPRQRLIRLLDALDQSDATRRRARLLLARFWREADLGSLFADFGFTARRDLWGEVGERLTQRWLPATPDTDSLATLFRLMFDSSADAHWLAELDAPLLARLTALFELAPPAAEPATADPADPAAAVASIDWRAPLLQALTWLVSSVRSAAFTPELRQRMDPATLTNRPFEQLVRVAEGFADALLHGDDTAQRQAATYLRALLGQCRSAADSVTEHLESHGISVHIVFEQDQLRGRCDRIEALMTLLLSPQPAHELCQLLAELVALGRARRGLGSLVSQHYSLLARKVAERHAETGEHYITRNRAEFADMLARAAGGGSLIGVSVFVKFGVLALGLAPFWSGFGAGLNYALCFLAVHLLHWTVATKQPAMTAPAMAEKLADLKREGAVEEFVDEVSHLVRSQFAGIVGNVAAVVPVVVLAQAVSRWLFGRPLVGAVDAEHILHSLTLLGPTAAFAAFTGVLLFVSSVVAGWAENWFVYHRLDSALAHHPGIVDRLGAPRAARWAAWWRANISGVTGNVCLGLMLGMLPVLLAFVGLPIEVRHITLGAGQVAAAASTLGWGVFDHAAIWWCAAGVVVTGALNVGVSFWCALRVAMRSRGIAVDQRRRLRHAIAQRLRTRPLSFLLPP